MTDPTLAGTPDIVTIVVNWNTVDLLDDCLRSVVEDTPPGVVNQIVVVDNASADGSVDHLRRQWPDVRVIANERNLGFCVANNQALRASTGPYALLINTDARVQPGAIGTMLGYFERNPRAAVVGPRLVYGDGSFQRWTAGQSFRLRTVANYLLGIERLLPGWRGAAGIYLGRDTAVPFQPAWVCSAVMMLRRQAIEEIGLFDERLFVYMDDVDLCERVRQAGWHVWYAADCTATHFMGASSKRVAHGASPEALRALNRWYVRRYGPRAGLLLRALEAVGFAARAAAYGGLSLLRRSPTARARMRAHATHFRLALEPIRV